MIVTDTYSIGFTISAILYIYRANTPPFMCARKVLEPLCGASRVKGGGGGGGGDADILWLCHKVPLEVVDLKHKYIRNLRSVLLRIMYRALMQCCSSSICMVGIDFVCHKILRLLFISQAGQVWGHGTDSGRLRGLLSVAAVLREPWHEEHEGPQWQDNLVQSRSS